MKAILFYFTLTAVIFFGCEDKSESGETSPIVYSKEIQPIFNKSCALSGCHLHADALFKINHGDTTLKLGSYTDLQLGTSDGGGVVVPFQPVFSSLFQHINTSAANGPVAGPSMPLNRDPLPEKEINLIKNWIEEGAKNDAGTPMYSNPALGSFLITNQGEDFLTKIDIGRKTISGIIPLFSPSWPVPQSAPEAPHYVAITPDYKTAVTTLYTAGDVARVNLVTRKVEKKLHVGGTPAHVELFDNGKKALVSNFSGLNKLHIIDVETMTLIRDVTNLASSPHGLFIMADGKTAFTAGNVSDLLYKVNLETGSSQSFTLSGSTPPIGEVKPKLGPYQIRKSGDLLYISCKFSGEVRIWNIQSEQLIDSIKVGKNPLLMDINSLTNELWVANQGDKTISIINLSTRSVSLLQGLPDQPHGIRFTPDGLYAGVTCENTTGTIDQHHPTTRGGNPGVFVLINAVNKTILATRNVGSFAAGIDFIP